jgi:hypothetical protein
LPASRCSYPKVVEDVVVVELLVVLGVVVRDRALSRDQPVDVGENFRLNLGAGQVVGTKQNVGVVFRDAEDAIG